MNTLTAGGVDIPVLGAGTWKLQGEDCIRIVTEALALGYRHIDTAAMYQNEREVGEALRASPIDRDAVFVTTKVWRDFIGAGDLQRAAEDSLKRLDLEHVDLLLIHWPNADIPLAESIGALCEVKRRGLARSIGLGNFPAALFAQAQALSDEPLVTNQVEFHPYLSQAQVLDAARRHGSSVTAHTPLAQGRVARDPVLMEISEALGVTPAQVALRWLIQQPAVIAIPKTASSARLAENFAIWDFALSDEAMARITSLARPDGRMLNPPWVTWDDA